MPKSFRITLEGNREEFIRGADEAIGSEDEERQHNFPLCEGPLGLGGLRKQ